MQWKHKCVPTKDRQKVHSSTLKTPKLETSQRSRSKVEKCHKRNGMWKCK